MNMKLWATNILLAMVMFFFSVQAYRTWTAPEESQPKAQPSKQTSSMKKSTSTLARFNMPPEPTFEDVARKNLFAKDRMEKIPEEPNEEQIEVKSTQAKISGKRIVLDGIIFTEDKKMALIRNPKRKKGDKKFIWIQEGQSIGNLKDFAIEEDRLIIKDKGKKHAILLYDQKPGKNNSASASTPSKSKKKSSNTTTVVSADKNPTKQSQPSPRVEENQGNGEYEIVKTPFGNLRRKRK